MQRIGAVACIIAAVLFWSPSLRATTILIVGADGKPVEGARVLISIPGKEGENIVEGQTGSDGIFDAGELPAEHDELEVMAWKGRIKRFEPIRKESGQWKDQYPIQLKIRVDRVQVPQSVQVPQRWILTYAYQYYRDEVGRLICERVPHWSPLIESPPVTVRTIEPCAPCLPAPGLRQQIYNGPSEIIYAQPSYEYDPCWGVGPQ